jgi:hemerythrin-like domain-containing protein
MQSDSRDARIIRALLLQEHLQLDVLFDCLLAAVGADATDDVATLWSAFDLRLREHLELEERHLIPAFAKSHPSDAARLLADHTLIRESLVKLGVALDLHLSRADMITKFVGLLRRHGAREDELLYAWSEQNLEPEACSSVLERLVRRHMRAPPHPATP